MYLILEACRVLCGYSRQQSETAVTFTEAVKMDADKVRILFASKRKWSRQLSETVLSYMRAVEVSWCRRCIGVCWQADVIC